MLFFLFVLCENNCSRQNTCIISFIVQQIRTFSFINESRSLLSFFALFLYTYINIHIKKKRIKNLLEYLLYEQIIVLLIH